jgi:ABC-2 type transport system ATP-binding protein
MRMLSGGMKRRVLVAQALVHRPPVIVLDEPTAGVDVELRQGLWQFIRKLNRDGHTIVLTTHYLEEAEACAGASPCSRPGASSRSTPPPTCCALRHPQPALCAWSIRRGVELGGSAGEGGWVDFAFDSYTEVEALLARLREAGAGLVEMRLGEPDLERVFVEVMNRA